MGPESILPAVVMNSGLVLRTPRNDTSQAYTNNNAIPGSPFAMAR